MPSLFLSAQEKQRLKKGLHEGENLCQVFWPLERRARQICEEPGWSHRGTTVQWWHAIADYTMTIGGTYALRPSPAKAGWLRETALMIARRSEQDWVGPAFRSHHDSEPVGNLETAHLTCAVVFALDLAPEIFTEAEREELLSCLRDKSIVLCRRWFEQRNRQQNWGMILLSGLTLAAAMLHDDETLDWCAMEYHRRLELFQDDGSYGESLQYASFAMLGLTLTGEALRRSDERFRDLSLNPIIFTPNWWAQALFYVKALKGWGAGPLPRSANFNDSAALFRPHGDVLMHLAARGAVSHPEQAGLAHWLFERLYMDHPPGAEASSETHIYLNEANYLSLLLFPDAAPPRSPEAIGLEPLQSFDSGETYLRQSWQPRTILAIKGEDRALHSKSHRHRDSGSFILVHNRERILLDPGHSCYRSALREFDLRTDFHNICTFSGLGQQNQREPQNGVHLPAGRRLLSARSDAGGVSIAGYELAAAYGEPLAQFSRFWILCGEHALFIADLVSANRPVAPVWHWLFNNRDGLLDIEQMKPGRLVGRRGDAGFKFTQPLDRAFKGPRYHFAHDAYHPLPAQQGEGRPGSGLMFQTEASQSAAQWRIIHPLALDSYAQITGWHAQCHADGSSAEIKGRHAEWRLTIADDASELRLEGAETLTLRPEPTGESWAITSIS